MAPRVTPVELADLDDLALVDGRYAHAMGDEVVVSRPSVHFYQRSGHSFTARDGAAVLGFVLAHATWSGGRPVVRIERLAGDAAGLRPLVEAVVKSAYDAGVYDIVATVPDTDGLAKHALGSATFQPRAATVLGRVLGSRGQRQASPPAGADGLMAGPTGKGG